MQLASRTAAVDDVALTAGTADLVTAWSASEPPARKALLQRFSQYWGVRILLYPDRRVAFVRR